MGSDHDILSCLPDAPAPSMEAREATIALALQRFDGHAAAVGSSPRRSARTGWRYAAAACLALGIATPFAWHYVDGNRQAEQFQMAAGTAHRIESPPTPMKTASDVQVKALAEAEPRSAPMLSYAPPAPTPPYDGDRAAKPPAKPSAAPSTTSPAWEACAAPEPERRIEGCTRLVEDQSQNQKLRAVAYLNRGAAHTQRGELDRALADYNEAIALDPDYAVAFYNRSLVHAAKGETDLAAADRARAIRIDPAYGAR
jgi:tetratricopeptide (TPR) repeat protein